MKLATQTPKKALKAFLKQKPLRSEIDVFKTNLIALLDKISVIEKRPTDESEEHLKNDLRDFLRDTYYRDTARKYGLDYIKKLPVPNVDDENQLQIINCVDKVLEAKKQGKDSINFEREIDELVYKLYDITEEEIKIIEGS